MIQPHRFIFFISILFTFCAANAQQEKELDTTKAKDILGWNPVAAEESILAAAKQIADYDLI